MSLIGKPLPRVDGPAKVTGAARYAADVTADIPPGSLAHGVLVTSPVARGRVVSMEAGEAEAMPGVIAVITHENAERLPFGEEESTVDPEYGRALRVLQDDIVYFSGQPIAVVVAESLEEATEAAACLRIRLTAEPPETDLRAALHRARPPTGEDEEDDYQRGDIAAGLESAAVKVAAEYLHPALHHNAIEPHATTAEWRDGRLIVHDKSQWVAHARRALALVFGLDTDDVEVVSPFVGGAFGSALRVWPHVVVAALASRHSGRPVKVELTRTQLYTGIGHKPCTMQRIVLGAGHDGRLVALRHGGVAATSTYEEYTENLLEPSESLYACPNVLTRYRLAELDINTPTHMRAPGVVSGAFALECAMDELSYALGMDPLELRLRNIPDIEPVSELPWSSNAFRECLLTGAERFGWRERPRDAGAQKAGRHLLGQGLAGAIYPVYRGRASARATVRGDGTVLVETAASDMGPGTYTSMTQIAADALEVPAERIEIRIGDSRMPYASAHGGSQTTNTVGSTVHAVCRALARKVVSKVGRPGINRMEDLLDRAEGVSASAQTRRDEADYAMHSFGAHFVEVGVDPELGGVRVRRALGVYGAGRIINPQTARSQALGGITMGIGMALMEAAETDHAFGRLTNANLVEYAVPVNADIPDVDVMFVDEEDTEVNPMGAKGLAELTTVGVAAAVCNAVYHAAGVRVRELPLTPDRILAAPGERSG